MSNLLRCNQTYLARTNETCVDKSEPCGEKAGNTVSEEKVVDRHYTNGDVPDGGLRAWLVVLGTFFACLSSFGFVNSWGAFQSYYESDLLKDTPVSNIAWIGSIQYSFCFIPSIIVGRLFDIGHFKLPFFLASCLLVLATFLTAQCRVYWQFLLCQGVAIGIASGMIFSPLWAVISHWFSRRKGVAVGIMACGSSVGGTVFPVLFHETVGRIGFAWTMRLMGFVHILSLGVANFTMTRRLPPVKASGGLLNFRVFFSIPFALYTASAFLAFLGIYTVLTYIVVSASESGVNSSFAFYLLSIANASSLVGRLSGGLLADRIGAINVMTPFTLCAALLTYVWPFVRGQAAYLVIAVLYGLSSGVYVSQIGIPIIVFGDMSDVGRRSGLCQNVLAFGALAGPPISGAINQSTGGFEFVGVYAGTAIVLSVCTMWMAKCAVLRRFWGRF